MYSGENECQKGGAAMEREVFLLPLPGEPLELPERLLRLVGLSRRERIQRLSDPRDRQAAAYAALLVRWCACRALGATNDALRFACSPAGKPYLKGEAGFHFSLSHARGAVAAAVSDREIGVDVEPLAPARSRVAKRCFTDREQAYLCAAADPDRAFYEIWTRKEAFLKYTGQGLRVPLRSVETIGRTGIRLSTFFAADCLLSVCDSGEGAPMSLTVFSEREFWERAQPLLTQPADAP